MGSCSGSSARGSVTPRGPEGWGGMGWEAEEEGGTCTHGADSHCLTAEMNTTL